MSASPSRRGHVSPHASARHRDFLVVTVLGVYRH